MIASSPTSSRSSLHARASALVVGLAVVLGAERSAVAQSPAARATAEALFQEGKRLMKAKQFGEACKKLEESYRIDPAPGTLLNLGLCHEAEGKTATAWAELKDARGAARKAGRADRERIADKHASALEPTLSRLTVVLGTGPHPEGLEVRLDGVLLGEGGLGTALPSDPGEHEIAASAPGHAPWSTKVKLGADADTETVTVPALVALPTPKPPSPPPPEPKTSWLLPAGIAVGSAGVIALGVGAVFGFRALSLASDSDAGCKAGVCNAEGFAAYEDSRSAATIADVLIPIGVGLGAIGGYLVFAADGGEPSPRVGSIAVGGAVAPGFAVMSARGAW